MASQSRTQSGGTPVIPLGHAVGDGLGLGLGSVEVGTGVGAGLVSGDDDAGAVGAASGVAATPQSPVGSSTSGA